MKKLPPNATTWTAVALIALGLVMIFLAWNGAAGAEAATDLRRQFPYLLSGGIFGLALMGSGLVLVRTFESRRDSREIVQQLVRLTAAVERLEQAQAPALAPDGVEHVVPAAPAEPALEHAPATTAIPAFEAGR